MEGQKGETTYLATGMRWIVGLVSRIPTFGTFKSYRIYQQSSFTHQRLCYNAKSKQGHIGSQPSSKKENRKNVRPGVATVVGAYGGELGGLEADELEEG